MRSELATDIEYGVVSISRLLKIIGLFCKRTIDIELRFCESRAVFLRKEAFLFEALLQKRPVILRSLLIKATPYSISVANLLLKKEGLLAQKGQIYCQFPTVNWPLIWSTLEYSTSVYTETQCIQSTPYQCPIFWPLIWSTIEYSRVLSIVLHIEYSRVLSIVLHTLEYFL